MKQNEIRKQINDNSKKIEEIDKRLNLLNMYDISYIINLLISFIPTGLSMLLIFVLSHNFSVGSSFLTLVPITTFGISNIVIDKVIKNKLNKNIKFFSNSRNDLERTEEMLNYKKERYKLFGENRFLKRINKNECYIDNNKDDLKLDNLCAIVGFRDKLTEKLEKYKYDSDISLKQSVLVNSFADVRTKNIKLIVYGVYMLMIWIFLTFVLSYSSMLVNSSNLLMLISSIFIPPVAAFGLGYRKYINRKKLFKKFNDELKENKISEIEDKNADKLIDENCKVKLDNLFNTQFQIKQFDNIITNLSMDIKKSEALNINKQYELENEKNDYNEKGFCKKLTLNK